MTLGFKRPGQIDGFWSWAAHSWKIVEPVTGRFYDRECGLRLLGVEWIRYDKDLPGQVL